MGARQSKRSVDITTGGAGSESGGEVVAGKLGKIEDGVVAPDAAALPKQNGDAVLKVTDDTAAAPGGDVPTTPVKDEKPVEDKPEIKPEEAVKTDEAPACEKPTSVAGNACEKPVAEVPPSEKVEEKVAEAVCEKPAATEAVCEKPAVMETAPAPAPAEPAKIEEPVAAPVPVPAPVPVEAVAEPIKTEEVMVEDTQKPETVESLTANEPEKKLDEEEPLPPPAAVENQKEVCDNSSPPSLPETLPPSQITVFAESLMAPPTEQTTTLQEMLPASSEPTESSPCPLPTPSEPLVSSPKVNDTPEPEQSTKPAEVIPSPTLEISTEVPVPQETTPTVPENQTQVQPEETVEVPVPVEDSSEKTSALKDVPAEVSVALTNVSAVVSDAVETVLADVPQSVEKAVETPSQPVRTPAITMPKEETQALIAPEVLLSPVEAVDNLLQSPATNATVESPIKKQEDLPSPPPSPVSGQEIDVNKSLEQTNESMPIEELPSPPPSPLSVQDASVSESGAVNTNTEEHLPSPPPSPAASMQDTSNTDSPLPPPVLEDLSQKVSSDQQKSSSFDDSAPLPPPPSAVESMTSVEYNEALMCPPTPEKQPVQQVTSNENGSEVLAAESTLNGDSMASQIIVSKAVDDKLPGMVMLEDAAPVALPNAETTMSVAEN